MKAGILACLELEANRRIAVIGAMGELGDESDAYHFEMGTILATHFEAIFACGLLVKPLLKGASTKGLADDRLFYRDSSEELVGLLQAFIKPGDLIFVKGSKSARMQLVAEALSGNS
jgi:UDP-N-acetylmuramoyl-tripeptide--D-alanyl-D-alanine ligase